MNWNLHHQVSWVSTLINVDLGHFKPSKSHEIILDRQTYRYKYTDMCVYWFCFSREPRQIETLVPGVVLELQNVKDEFSELVLGFLKSSLQFD